MGPHRIKSSDAPVSTTRIRNKQRRQQWHVEQKKAKDSTKRELRFRRRREELKKPHLRDDRRAQNVPVTIERKRVWDEVEDDERRRESDEEVKATVCILCLLLGFKSSIFLVFYFFSLFQCSCFNSHLSFFPSC